MQVNNAYRRRTAKEEDGTWGNDTVENMLRRHGWLRPLVVALQQEEDCFQPHHPGLEWAALFFEDEVRGESTTVSVELKPSRSELEVPSLVLRPDALATVEEVKTWVINHIHFAI